MLSIIKDLWKAPPSPPQAVLLSLNLGSWLKVWEDGTCAQTMPPPLSKDCLSQAPEAHPVIYALSLPLLPLIPTQRSRMPGGGGGRCQEVDTALSRMGPNGRISSQGAEAMALP